MHPERGSRGWRRSRVILGSFQVIDTCSEIEFFVVKVNNDSSASRTLDLAASVVLGEPEAIMPMQRDGHTVPSRQRLEAVAVLAERETRLSALQRLALVDAAASWLSELAAGTNWLMRSWAAAYLTEVTAEHAYLALITPSENPEDDHFEGLPS